LDRLAADDDERGLGVARDDTGERLEQELDSLVAL
jgi:hypothetical protein